MRMRRHVCCIILMIGIEYTKRCKKKKRKKFIRLIYRNVFCLIVAICKKILF